MTTLKIIYLIATVIVFGVGIYNITEDGEKQNALCVASMIQFFIFCLLVSNRGFF